MIEFLTAENYFMLKLIAGIVVTIITVAMLIMKVVTVKQVKEMAIAAWQEYLKFKGIEVDPTSIGVNMANEFGQFLSEKLPDKKLNSIVNLGIKANKNKKKPTFVNAVTSGAFDIVKTSAKTALINIAGDSFKRMF